MLQSSAVCGELSRLLNRCKMRGEVAAIVFAKRQQYVAPAPTPVGQVSRQWVTEFMRYVNTVGIASDKYAHGRYLTLASFLRSSAWARRENRQVARTATRAKTLTQLGLTDTRRATAATGMQVLLIDKSGTMTPAAMQQEAAYRCSNRDKFEFVELV